MDQIDKNITQQLREIINPDVNFRHPVMTGVVRSVDDGEMTAIVQLTNDDESAPTEGVTLNVLLNNTAGIYALPAEGADCLVMEVDGPGKWELLKAASYDRVYMKAGGKFVDITNSVMLLNGDSKGGIPVVGALLSKINALENKVNALNAAVKSTTIALAPTGTYPLTTNPAVAALSDLTPTQRGDIENTNVKHG